MIVARAASVQRDCARRSDFSVRTLDRRSLCCAPGKAYRVEVQWTIDAAEPKTGISRHWEALKEIADRDGVSLNAVIAQIDAARTDNLSSAIRIYVLKRLRQLVAI